MTKLQKFGRIVEGKEEVFSYPGTWAKEKTTGPHRLVIAPAGDHIELIKSLAGMLEGPLWFLYVLCVARGGGECGRYQSPETVSFEEAMAFLDRFRGFLEEDGRHELWISSASSDARIVYDNHNIVYLYGPLDSFIGALSRQMIAHSDRVELPFPHHHYYWPEHDSSEAELLSTYEWVFFPAVLNED